MLLAEAGPIPKKGDRLFIFESTNGRDIRMNRSRIYVTVDGTRVVVNHFGIRYEYPNYWGALAFANTLYPSRIITSFRGWREDVTTA